MNILRITFLTVLFVLCLGPGYSSGQSVCVIKQQKVKRVRGIVKYAGSDTRIKKAKLTLTSRDEDDEKVIEEKMSDDKGWFEFETTIKGKYVLIVSSPNTKTLYIPLKVGRGKKTSILEISLGVMSDEPCWGGDVNTIKCSLLTTIETQ